MTLIHGRRPCDRCGGTGFVEVPPRQLIYAPTRVPTIPMNVRVPQTLAYRLHDACKAKGILKQEFITAAILEALAKNDT